MLLLHGGNPKHAGLIAARCRRSLSSPDWMRHGKAAPFKRNDQMLDVLPIAVVLFPGTGIQDNLADKARKLGIALFDFPKGGA